jgi:DNA-binding NtrC family response regulator
MPSSQDAFPVLAITSNDSLWELIKSTLSRDQAYLFIDQRLKADELMESIESLRPQCIILDFLGAPTKPLELIDSLAWQFPDTAIIVVLPKEQVAEANRVILAGARAFVAQPLNQQELLDTLGRIREVFQRSQRSRAAAAAGRLHGEPRDVRGVQPEGRGGVFARGSEPLPGAQDGAEAGRAADGRQAALRRSGRHAQLEESKLDRGSRAPRRLVG